MSIRRKITLLITAAGIFTSLLFSLIIFWEMLEQPYRLIDSDLKVVARRAFIALNPSSGQSAATGAPSIPEDRYWIRVYDRHRNIVYQSDLARRVALPLRQGKKKYTVHAHISEAGETFRYELREAVTFRVRVVRMRSGGSVFTVQIARPIEKLAEEIREVVLIFILGLIVSGLVLVFISYVIAGLILKPVAAINSLAREITDKTLDKRIPLGKSHDELHALSSSLNRMFDRLQYSFMWQKQFIAAASHELKTPITMLRLFNDEAVQRPDLPESFRKQMLNQAAILIRIDRLVRSLLSLSALELKESIAPKMFDLATLIQAVLEDFAIMMASEKIRLKTNLPNELRMQGDREMIRRMLINLLDNALKYNRKAGEISLTVRETVRSVDIILYNTGPGIPTEDLGRVFEQFYRVEKSRSLQYGGSGLGLTIVQQIIRLHRGHIKIESEPEAWTRLEITLPKRFK